MGENFQYQFENLVLWFQGGVRRGFIIVTGIILILIVPFYFLVTLFVSIWASSGINSNKIVTESFFNQKNIPFKDLIFSNTQVVPLKDGSNELYLSINNKANTQIGYVPYVYDLSVLDKEGRLITTETRETYLLPGEIRYIVYNSKDNSAANLKLVKNSRSTPIYYNPFSKNYKKPKISISGIKYEIRTSTNILYINFTIKNDDQIKVNKTDLLYTVRDSRESVVGIGQYVVDDLEPGQQRDISITYVQPLLRDPKLVNIEWSVNYLDAKNINLI